MIATSSVENSYWLQLHRYLHSWPKLLLSKKKMIKHHYLTKDFYEELLIFFDLFLLCSNSSGQLWSGRKKNQGPFHLFQCTRYINPQNTRRKNQFNPSLQEIPSSYILPINLRPKVSKYVSSTPLVPSYVNGTCESSSFEIKSNTCVFFKDWQSLFLRSSKAACAVNSFGRSKKMSRRP